MSFLFLFWRVALKLWGAEAWLYPLIVLGFLVAEPIASYWRPAVMQQQEVGSPDRAVLVTQTRFTSPL